MARVRGYWDDARERLASALGDDPENEACLLEMGLLHHDMGISATKEKEREQFLTEALLFYRRALRVAPWNPRIVVSLAIAERLTGNSREAKQRLEELLRHLPSNEYAVHALALCDMELGNGRAMINRLQAINEKRRGRNLPVRFSLVQEMVANGQQEEARRIIQDIVQHRIGELAAVKKIDALLEAARLHLVMGNVPDAKRLMEQAQNLDPGNLRIKTMMNREGI
jgi:tetratricopeptide (TPR) repeat protein